MGVLVAQEVRAGGSSNDERAAAEKGRRLVTAFISPLGKSLLGKSPGDVVEVKAPIGVLRYRIETIGN